MPVESGSDMILKISSGAVTIEFMNREGCHEVWMNYPGDEAGAFLIGASEIAEGGTPQLAIQNAMGVLSDAASLLVDSWKDLLPNNKERYEQSTNQTSNGCGDGRKPQ